MRRLLAALFCLALISPAYAQKTKTQLNTEIGTNLPDNTVGAITPALVRITLLDMVASWLDLSGGGAFNCSVNTFINAYSNLSTPSCSQPAFSNLTGNIAVSQMNSGTGASSTTVWKGDGTWGTVTGTGTVTEQKNTAGIGLSTSGNCDNTSTNSASPCQYNLAVVTPTTSLVTTTAHNGGFSANGSGTYTTPANVRWLEVKLIGGGGGGGGANTIAPAGSGGNTCWNTTGAACTSPVYQAGGGGLGTTGGGNGGTVSGSGACSFAVAGGSGGGGAQSVSGSVAGVGGTGGNSFLGGGGGSSYASNGLSPAGDSGSGGGGGAATSTGTVPSGAGGGAGAICGVIISAPAATYTYVVGAGGTLGSGSGAGFNGAAGAGGQIQVIEHYGF